VNRFYSLGTIIVFVFPLFTRAADHHGPWDVKALRQSPKVTWADESGPLRKLYYESEPMNGKPTCVFAYLARPEKAGGKLPAMVLVHGGGGTAFREWAEVWAKRGYVALAMDLAGRGPDKMRLPDGGPDQDDVSKIPPEPKPLKEIWSYHAVAMVIRGVSLLQSLPEVDPEKIGVTGISWGGYLTCIVMGLDDRLKVAVPVYGCGFLDENSAWLPTFQKFTPDWRREWVKNFDPSQYAGQAKMPVLFVNGANDFAYPLDSYQKTYRLVKDRTFCVTVNMPHGHPQGWAPVEIGLFVDSHLKGGKALPKFDRISTPRTEEDKTTAVLSLEYGQGVKSVHLHWTTDVKAPWQKRMWQTRKCDGAFKETWAYYVAEFPKTRPLVWFMTVIDDRGATVSTEHQELKK
jgi:dienelactone hydrolase